MEYIWKTFLVINFLFLIHTEIILKEFTLAQRKEQQGQGPFSQEMTKNRDTIPMPTFARRPSTVTSLMLVECPQNSMVGHQRQQISELQFDKFPNAQSLSVWKIRFKSQVTTCSDFPSEAILWIKEVEMSIH